MQYEIAKIMERAREREADEERKASGENDDADSMDLRSMPLENECVRKKNKHLKSHRPMTYKQSKLYEPLDSDGD